MTNTDDLTFLIAGWDSGDDQHAPPWCRNLATAIIDAGWKSPQQIEQTKAEVLEQGGAVGENYGFQSHSRIRPARPKNPYRKDTK